MKSEWKTFCFECVPYRESGVSILSGVEDVQQMLDDHILKAQTMHRYLFFFSINMDLDTTFKLKKYE